MLEAKVILAPLAGYTHSPFRRLVKSLGADVVWSEMVSAEMVVRRGGEDPLLEFSEEERPIAIQLFGRDPERLKEAAEVVMERKRPEILDLNAGCPARKVVSKGAGAALLKDLSRLKECASAICEVARRYSALASVKTRLGWDEDRLEEIAEALVEAGVSAIVLHARLATQGFSGAANWKRIRDLVKMVPPGVFVVGNGDVTHWRLVEEMFRETGCAAVMVGRAAVKNPWIFKEFRQRKDLNAGVFERAEFALRLFEEMRVFFGEKRACAKVKAILAQLFKGIPFRKRFVSELLTAKSASELTEGLVALRNLAHEDHLLLPDSSESLEVKTGL